MWKNIENMLYEFQSPIVPHCLQNMLWTNQKRPWYSVICLDVLECLSLQRIVETICKEMMLLIIAWTMWLGIQNSINNFCLFAFQPRRRCQDFYSKVITNSHTLHSNMVILSFLPFARDVSVFKSGLMAPSHLQNPCYPQRVKWACCRNGAGPSSQRCAPKVMWYNGWTARTSGTSIFCGITQVQHFRHFCCQEAPPWIHWAPFARKNIVIWSSYAWIFSGLACDLSVSTQQNTL